MTTIINNNTTTTIHAQFEEAAAAGDIQAIDALLSTHTYVNPQAAEIMEELTAELEEGETLTYNSLNDLLAIAALHGHLPLIIYLEDRGASILSSQENPNDMNDALLPIAEGGHVHILEYAVIRGLKLSRVRGVDFGREAMSIATFHGHLDMVQYLQYVHNIQPTS